MSERLRMTVSMEVTRAQALALQTMFEHWNYLSGIGSSRMVGFFVDGDGNFHPRCVMTYSDALPPLTDELRQKARCKERSNGEQMFDFDGIAWAIEH